MIQCKICGAELKCISPTHLKKHDLSVEDYKKMYPKEIFFDNETRIKLSKSRKGQINMGDKNAAKRIDVKKKIKDTVTKRWKEGVYQNRLDGIIKEVTKDVVLSRGLSGQHKNILSNFQDITTCSTCSSKKMVQVHHIDEDHENFLPSNLEPLCEPCHKTWHTKKPYISITRIFSFAGAHFLPDYSGKCNNLHGHEWKLEVTVKRRINTKTGMVMDFGDLKKVVEEYIINIFDHNCLNHIIMNPTAENILIWTWEQLMFKALLKGIEKITIWEAPNSYAVIDVNGMFSVFNENIENYLKIN